MFNNITFEFNTVKVTTIIQLYNKTYYYHQNLFYSNSNIIIFHN